MANGWITLTRKAHARVAVCIQCSTATQVIGKLWSRSAATALAEAYKVANSRGQWLCISEDPAKAGKSSLKAFGLSHCRHCTGAAIGTAFGYDILLPTALHGPVQGG